MHLQARQSQRRLGALSLYVFKGHCSDNGFYQQVRTIKQIIHPRSLLKQPSVYDRYTRQDGQQGDQ